MISHTHTHTQRERERQKIKRVSKLHEHIQKCFLVPACQGRYYTADFFFFFFTRAKRKKRTEKGFWNGFSILELCFQSVPPKLRFFPHCVNVCVMMIRAARRGPWILKSGLVKAQAGALVWDGISGFFFQKVWTEINHFGINPLMSFNINFTVIFYIAFWWLYTINLLTTWHGVWKLCRFFCFLHFSPATPHKPFPMNGYVGNGLI